MALELRVTAVLQAVANEFVLWCLAGAKGLPCPSQGAASLVPGSFGHFLCFCRLGEFWCGVGCALGLCRAGVEPTPISQFLSFL